MALAMLVAYGICCASGQPLLFAPLAGTAVIVFGTPDAEMARWRAALGGHVISAASGLLCLYWAPPDALRCFVAVIGSALAFFLMMCSDTLHSPAGATPIALVALHYPMAPTTLVLGHLLAA